MSSLVDLESYPSPSASHRALVWLGLLSLLLLFYRWLLPKPIKGIPYDEEASQSLLGNLVQILAFRRANDDQIIPWFVQQAQRNEWALSQFWPAPFASPSLILSDFRESQDILLRRNKEFGRGSRIHAIFANTTPEFHVALSTEDPRYKRNKDLVKDIMSPSFLEMTSAPHIYNKSCLLVDLWNYKTKIAPGAPFEAREDIFCAISDMITGAAFALDEEDSTVKQRLQHLQSAETQLNALNGKEDALTISTVPMKMPYYEAFRRLSDHQGNQTKASFPRLSHYFKMIVDKNLRNAYRSVKRFEAIQIEKSINRLKGGEPTTSALDHLIKRESQEAQKEGREPVFHQRRVYDEMSGYYMAGHETSATTVTWLVKFLSQDLQSQKKLYLALRQNHSLAAGEERQPTVIEILQTKVPYLEAVIDETLRMSPPFSLQMREALIDTTLLGHSIPKGTVVFMPVLGPSFRSPAIPVSENLRSKSSLQKQWDRNWSPEDIHKFNPERWLTVGQSNEETFHDPQAGPFQSFGLGPRQCFGKRLAYLQLRVLVTILVWNFGFHEVDGIFGSNDAIEAATRQPKHCYVNISVRS